jgi:hypothetical protein
VFLRAARLSPKGRHVGSDRGGCEGRKARRTPALEAYPVDTAQPDSTSNVFTGTAATFRRAGFRTVARRVSSRPIMHHDLRGIAS